MQTLVLTSSVNHGVGQGNEKLGNGQEKEKPLPHKAPTEIVVEMLALPYARQSAVSETGKKTVVESDQKHTSLTAQIWDKGVNVKEYIVNKIEPGKALSQFSVPKIDQKFNGGHNCGRCKITCIFDLPGVCRPSD
ncbi:hypothetical protein ACOSP7_024918 [Xanthoceras sorbifolium]